MNATANRKGPRYGPRKMEKVPTVKLGLTGLSDTALLEKGRNHVTMLTGNPNFPPPTTPPAADITTACDLLETSIQEVQFFGGKVAHELKRTRAKAVRALIKELGGYIQANCDGDRNKILSAGFDVVPDPTPVEELAMPQNLRALLTNAAGEVPVRWNVVDDATNYLVEVNNTDPDEESGWTVVAYTSRSRYIVTGLTTAKFYWFRVQALGRKGLKSPLSESIKTLAA